MQTQWMLLYTFLIKSRTHTLFKMQNGKGTQNANCKDLNYIKSSRAESNLQAQRQRRLLYATDRCFSFFLYICTPKSLPLSPLSLSPRNTPPTTEARRRRYAVSMTCSFPVHDTWMSSSVRRSGRFNTLVCI